MAKGFGKVEESYAQACVICNGNVDELVGICFDNESYKPTEAVMGFIEETSAANYKHCIKTGSAVVFTCLRSKEGEMYLFPVSDEEALNFSKGMRDSDINNLWEADRKCYSGKVWGLIEVKKALKALSKVDPGAWIVEVEM